MVVPSEKTTMVVHQPSLQHRRWVAIVPHRTPLVPRARMLVFISTSSSRARPCSNILAHEAAPGPNFRVSRVFVSPVQPALLPGSPRTDGFHVLVIDYWSPTEQGQGRVTRYQQIQLGNQLSHHIPGTI